VEIMLKRSLLRLIKDPLWLKVASLSLILFFVFLADAILAYWVPNFLEGVVENTASVGLIISSSSVVGLLADLILPQIIKDITVKRLIFLSIVLSLFCNLTLLYVTWEPLLILLLLSMAIWGVYYEFIIFAAQQFVSDSTPVKFHSSAWGIVGVFKSLAYFLGPIVGSSFLIRQERYPLYVSIFFLVVSYVFLLAYKGHHDRLLTIKTEEVNLLRELNHWRVLFVRVWPVVVMSLIVGFIEASFWTVGAIWNEILAQRHWLGGMFLSSYVLPSLFAGFVIAKWGIYKGKKKMAEKFIFLSGLIFVLMGTNGSVLWQVFAVFLASTFISLASPLIDGVYSDIVSRMGRKRRHMIGLSSSTISFAYIIGPVVSGFISSFVGIQLTFAVLGILIAVVSVFLLLLTPRKLLLPQEEIRKWGD
jgi:MFS family permease